jgi:hypothetical protein
MVHCFVTQWAPNELGHNHYGGEGQLKESYLLDKRVMVGFEIVGFCACITMFFYSGGWSGWTPENCDTERRRGYSAYTNTVLSWTRCVLQLEWATCSGKFNFPFVYSEEDQSCLPNSRVGRSTALAKSTVSSAKAQSESIATYYVWHFPVIIVVWNSFTGVGKITHQQLNFPVTRSVQMLRKKLSSSHQAKPDDGGLSVL